MKEQAWLCAALAAALLLAGCQKQEAGVSASGAPAASAGEAENEAPSAAAFVLPGEGLGFAPLPEGYFSPCEEAGRLERVDYEGPMGPKHAYVYVPYGYETGGSEQYDIVYFMHGGGGSAETYLGSDTQPGAFVSVLDHMIANGELRAMLFVAPSFYPENVTDKSKENAGTLAAAFPEELIGGLMPAVEGRYRTWAPTADAAGFSASRTHRGFGGFSMGAVTTWHVFAKSLAYFDTFFPISGDSWAIEQMGGGTRSAETAVFLAKSVQQAGFGPEAFRIFAATGTKDIALDDLGPQVEAMKALPDIFRYSETGGEGNLQYLMAEGLDHTTDNARALWANTLRLAYPAG